MCMYIYIYMYLCRFGVRMCWNGIRDGSGGGLRGGEGGRGGVLL